MSDARRKYAQSLLDQLVVYGMDPWERMTRQAAFRRGPLAYSTPLVPGYDVTYGDVVDAEGGGGGQEDHKERLEEKGQVRRGKKMFGILSKFSGEGWEYEDGGKQHYGDVETGPGNAQRDYSPARERDNLSGMEIAWDQVGEGFYRDSKEPEPPLLNQRDYNFSTLVDYKAAAYEPEVTESQTHVLEPPWAGDDSSDHALPRQMATLFAENEMRDPMTNEVPYLNFRQDVQKAAALITMDHALGFGGGNDPSVVIEDQKDPDRRLPGKRPQVDNAVWSDTESVWDQHESFLNRPNSHAIIDYPAQPGPAV